MELFAPKYYKKFKCIADKCEHSCCVGWEIDIDDKTLNKYKKLRTGYANTVNDSISEEQTPHFILKKDEKCPHLDENGLCKIIINLGEEYLCDICREHPRFYNYTSVAEVGIGMSCREAARIILSSSDYATFELIGSVSAETDACDFDGISERGKVYEILKDTSISYAKRLEKIRKNYGIELEDDAYWLKILNSLEYLDENHKTLFMKYSKDSRTSLFDEALERFLAYFIYRHTTEASCIEDFSLRLKFCLFCESLFASLIACESAKSINELAYLASIISEEIEYSSDNTYDLTYY